MRWKARSFLWLVAISSSLLLLCTVVVLLQRQQNQYQSAINSFGNRAGPVTVSAPPHYTKQRVTGGRTFPPSPQPQHTSNEDDVDPSTLLLSENPDIDVRGKFQQKRISAMCRKHFFSGEQRLPANDNLSVFFRHLMFDDKRKAIFCFVPKIGCTDMKRLFLYMGGQLPLNTLDWPWVEDKIYIEPALSKVSFLNKTLFLKEKIDRMKSYYKFMVVRNPLERLVSAFRNKLEAPVSYERQDKFPHHLKVEILERVRSAELHYWQRSHNGKQPVNISVTFPDFVQYFIETDVARLNDHYRPSIDICHPCLVKYSFYGNFRNFSSDVAQLIRRLDTDPRFYRDKSLHSSAEQTSRLLPKYYGQLLHRDKVRLIGKLYDDLLFYYTLYPADRHTHRHLLGIQHPIF